MLQAAAGRTEMNTRVLFSVFFRTYLVGAAFNTKGLQNIGFSYVVEPGLRAIYQGKKLQKARRRYLGLYNTHLFWTPMLAGIFLFLEQKIARDLIPVQAHVQLRSTLSYTLSAIGDSFLSGSFFIFWSLVSISFCLLSWYQPMFVFWGGCFVLLQAVKLYTFYLGLTQGLDCLQRLQRWDLINWGQRLKFVNACLLPVIWYLFLPLNADWTVLLAGGLSMAAAVWLIHVFPAVREIILLCLLFLFWEQERIFMFLGLAG